AVGPLALSHCEHAEGKPFLFLARLGLLARVGELNGLLRVLFLRADRIAVDVDGVAFVDDVRAVVVVGRFGGIAPDGGKTTPGGAGPSCCADPCGRSPGVWILRPPTVAKGAVVAVAGS